MISLPPNERDLHAYVDHQLSEPDRRQLQIWLAAHPEVAAQVHAWQQDAQHLRTAIGAPPAANPELDPAQIRQRLKHQSRRQLATAAMLVLAVGLGGLGGWQARQATLVASALPMTDAMQAYRLLAQNALLPAE